MTGAVTNMNTTQLIGNLTRDPEGKQIRDDLYVANFSIAVSNRKKDDNGDYGVDFFECTLFGKTAENLVKYQKKGMRLGVSGRLEQQTWKEKESGKDRSKIVVICNDVDWLTTKAEAAGVTTDSSPEPFAEDDLAF